MENSSKNNNRDRFILGLYKAALQIGGAKAQKKISGKSRQLKLEDDGYDDTGIEVMYLTSNKNVIQDTVEDDIEATIDEMNISLTTNEEPKTKPRKPSKRRKKFSQLKHSGVNKPTTSSDSEVNVLPRYASDSD